MFSTSALRTSIVVCLIGVTLLVMALNLLVNGSLELPHYDLILRVFFSSLICAVGGWGYSIYFLTNVDIDEPEYVR